MLKYLNLEKQIMVNKVSSEYFKKTYFAPRPASEQLVNLKLKKINANLTRDWQICLKEYLTKFDWGLSNCE
jgi:dTDP-4-dehydrorhamnose reductase